MAVDPRFERQGFGKLLLHHGEATLLHLRAVMIALAAREHVVGFYGKFGYVARGEPFIEVTIPHLLMVKQLHARPAC